MNHRAASVASASASRLQYKRPECTAEQKLLALARRSQQPATAAVAQSATIIPVRATLFLIQECPLSMPSGTQWCVRYSLPINRQRESAPRVLQVNQVHLCH